MRRGSLLLLFLAIALATQSGAVQAAYQCQLNPAPATVSTAYGTSYPFNNVTQGVFTIRCRRTAVGDAATVNWTVRPNNNGNNPLGSQNRAASGGNRLLYEPYTDGSCMTNWATGVTIGGTLALPTVNVYVSTTANFWVCIPPLQPVAAGTYIDRIQLITNTGATANLNTSTVVPGTCSITTAPGILAFAYTAFGPLVNASTTFRATCTNRLPYSIALDASIGVVAAVGLQYSLSLSAATSRGTGAAQTHTISGTIPGGQAGTCATATCTGTDTRSITITY